jgi:hypothetical protein
VSSVSLDSLPNLLAKGRFRVIAVMKMELDFSPSRPAELRQAGELPLIILVPWIEETVRRWAAIIIPVPGRNERVLTKPLLKPPPRNVLPGLMDLRLEVVSNGKKQMNWTLCSQVGL